MSETLQFLIVVIRISRGTCQCTSVDTEAPIDGMACQPFEYQNIMADKPEFCSLACIQIDRCEATIYDRTLGMCMLMNDPCFSPKPYFNHLYQSYKHKCTKWVPDTENHIAYSYIEAGTQRSYVSRKAHDGNMVVGKKTSYFFAVNPIDSTGISLGSHELLVVESSCSVAWVAYDSSSNQPLPRGALIGGILTATNTPLYVTRMIAFGARIGGYYNPLNGKAWGSHSGARNSTIFEVMIVNVP